MKALHKNIVGKFMQEETRSILELRALDIDQHFNAGSHPCQNGHQTRVKGILSSNCTVYQNLLDLRALNHGSKGIAQLLQHSICDFWARQARDVTVSNRITSQDDRISQVGTTTSGTGNAHMCHVTGEQDLFALVAQPAQILMQIGPGETGHSFLPNHLLALARLHLVELFGQRRPGRENRCAVRGLVCNVHDVLAVAASAVLLKQGRYGFARLVHVDGLEIALCIPGIHLVSISPRGVKILEDNIRTRFVRR